MPTQTLAKILFFADTHLGFDYPIRPRIKRRRRGYDFFDNYAKILKYASISKPDLLIHGGDFFFRSKVPQKIIDLAYQPLFNFVKTTQIPVYIIPGNHERSILPHSVFLNHPLIRIFNRPKTFLFKIRNIKIQISGFPFFRKIDQCFKDIVQQSGWEKESVDIKLLCMHQAVQGAQVGPSNFTFKESRDVIKKTDLPGDATAILSGHIHRRQLLYKNEVPVIYPGSIERTSFAEKDETKGFYELHFTKNIRQSWTINKYHFLRLPSRPMTDFLLTGLNDPQRIESEIKSKIQTLPHNSIIRFKCQTVPGPEFKALFSSKFIRSILPYSMNFQFSLEFYSTG